MPNNMTAQEKMALVMMAYNNIFGSKANGVDIITVKIVHPNIVNGKPILSNGQRVGGEIQGRWFKNGVTGESTLRGFDIDIQTDNKILQLRFIEQNPDKVDAQGHLKPMAVAARKGSKIMWLIDRKAKPGENGFLARVQDGVFKPSQERAVAPVAKSAPAPVVQPAQNVQRQVASQTADEEIVEDLPWEEDSIPDLSDDGIPESVMKFYADMEPGDEAEFGEF